MTFNDGDPIDAAGLGALESALAELKSKVPQFGSSTTSVNVDNRSFQNAIVPRIYGNKSASKQLTPGSVTSFVIDYSEAGFTAKPNSITITPMRGGSKYVYDHYILSTSVTDKGFTINAFQPAGTDAITLTFYYLAIQHS